MAERLIIQNFAGLNIDIELGRINIFIGPQASGKSVCIKCIACFQAFIDFIFRCASEGGKRQDIEVEFIEYFSSLLTISENEDNFILRYSINDYYVELSSVNQHIHLSYSSYYRELFSKLKSAHSRQSIPSFSDLTDSSPLVTAILEDAKEKVGDPRVNRLFVPTNRAYFSLLHQTGRVPLAVIADDPMAVWFQSFYHFLKKQQNRLHYKEFPHRNGNKTVVKLIHQILRATLAKEDKEDVVIHQNGSRTSMRQASSGQQEVLPLLRALEYLVRVSSRDAASMVFVEEPETHLHPTAQHDLVNLMAAVYNISSKPLQLFITTHTPYLLSSFNNLIYAGQLASKLKKNDSAGRKKLYAAVPKELHLNLADFRVYGLEDGKATLLIDEEFGLLMAHSIDSVSDIIADQFGDLMALDPANKPSAAN